MTENKWYRSTGQDGDVVISTRVRLARNLPRVPFPACLLYTSDAADEL